MSGPLAHRQLAHRQLARRRTVRALRRALPGLIAAVVVASGGGVRHNLAAASPAAPADALLTYRLADTWSDFPFVARAGRYIEPLDISSAPDGAIFVLDRATRGVKGPNSGSTSGPALHLLAPDGRPKALYALYDVMTAPARIDAGPDGSVHVLGQQGGANTIAQIAADGRLIRRFTLPGTALAADVAVAGDGRVYVARSSASAPLSRIEVFTADGMLLESIVPIEMGIPDIDAGYPSLTLRRLDVAPDGRTYLALHAERPCTPVPYTPPPRTPVPTRTPRPSLDSSASAPAAPDQAGCEIDLILVFTPDHRWERTVRAYCTDLAAGAGGVYLSNRADVIALDESRARASHRRTRWLGGTGYSTAGEMSLDLDVSGRLHATVRESWYYNGAVTFGDPGAPSQAALGIYDQPTMRGPTYPLRIAAATEVLVLDAPFAVRVGPDGRQTVRSAAPDTTDRSALQRWSPGGHLLEQRVQYRTSYIAGEQIVDLAHDGQDTFVVSDRVIGSRPDPLPPIWNHMVPTARFIAVAAQAGRVAALDIRGRRVVMLNRDGAQTGEWPLAAAGAASATGSPSDLALAGDRVVLADQGRNRVMLRGLDGSDHGEWPTHDGPRRVAVGPEGDVYVLGRGGFGLRYTPGGALVAAWRMPPEHAGFPVEGQDIAVGADGRVYVSFIGLSDQDLGDRLGWRIDTGGVWVFEPDQTDAPPGLPRRGGCVATPDKRAAPPVLLRGEPVDLTLAVDGLCPGRFEKQELMIVFDTSWSMTYPQFGSKGGRLALDRAKAVLDPLLAALDAERVTAGLVTFDDGAALEVPLPGDIGAMRARVAALAADGDTQMGAGIDLAQRELEGPHGDPDAKKTLLIVSDGIFKDDPGPAIAAARTAGIDIAALVVTTAEFTPAARSALLTLLGDPGRVFVDLDPPAAGRLIAAIAAYVPNRDLFETITIRDTIPPNMRYMPGSARPEASYDPAAHALTWSLTDIPSAGGLRLTYRLIPRDPGTWPTNVEAHADYRDALGAEGRLVFPIPRVSVLEPYRVPSETPRASATPTASMTPSRTPTPPASPTPTVTPTPAPIYLPVAMRRACRSGREPLDIVLVHDISSTMGLPAGTGPRNKLAHAVAAAQSFLLFVDWLRDRVGIVAFDAGAVRVIGLSGDRAAVDGALGSLEVGWGTRIDYGLAEARRLVEAEGRPGAVPVVILLSDGLQNGSDLPVRAEAAALKALGVTIFTIGLGPDAAPELLGALASSPAHRYLSPQVTDLAGIYVRIATDLPCGRGP
jgi:Mg-chelatase subunit ChlD